MLMSGDMTGVAQSISCSTAEEQEEVFRQKYSSLFVRENLHLFTKLSLKDFWNLDFEGMSTREILRALEVHGRYTPEQVREGIPDVDTFRKYSIPPTSAEYERLFMNGTPEKPAQPIYLSPPLDKNLTKDQSDLNVSV